MKSLEECLLELLPKVRRPSPYDKVYKEECMFSYDSPLSKGGLYLNLQTLQAFGEEFVDLDFQRNQFPLYLHEKWTKVPLPEDEMEKLKAHPERLAINKEGGFLLDKEKFQTEKYFQLVLFPEHIEIPLILEEIPEELQTTIVIIQAHEGASSQQPSDCWEEQKIVSKYAENLEQLENEKKDLSNPSLWICAESGERKNLWLNLSTGYIGSGRAQTGGSDGTGAALRHYEETGKKYPLVVKLGTITPAGADVHSYDPEEDSIVKDPYLKEHLLFWGIDMNNMKKTVKTTDELQVELNLAFEFDKIVESNRELIPMSGPCYIGLKNLGNSCYINSVMQVLWMLPTVRDRYLTDPKAIFLSAGSDPSMDFPTQMAKLGVALIQGRTGKPEDPTEKEEAVKPLAFKMIVGNGHPDFSTGHQQDASHFFMHLLEVMDRAEKTSTDRLPHFQELPLTSSMFGFQLEERIMCMESNRVKYNVSQNVVLGLHISLEMALNKQEVDCYNEREMKRQKLKESGADVEILLEGVENGVPKISEITKDDVEEKILPIVPFSACIEKFVGDNVVEDYDCEFLKRKTQALKNTKMKTFPPYLMIQLKRYYQNDRWEPKKMEVLVEPPEELILENLRGLGAQPEELLQPEAEQESDTRPIPDPEIVDQLIQMGFPLNGVNRAALAVNNQSAQAAMDWVLSHMDDADFDQPLEKNGAQQGPPIESIQILQGMGMTEDSAKAALIHCDDDVEAAANWLLTNVADLDTLVPQILSQAETAQDSKPDEFLDGKGVYDLIGFISHMGSSTACGHYVCHIKKKDKWIIFNDEKVAISETPPKDLGFMYLYKRRDIGGLEE